MEEVYLSVTEAAKFLGTSRNTIYKWIKEALLPYSELPSSGCRPLKRISRKDLIDFVERHKRVGTEDNIIRLSSREAG